MCQALGSGLLSVLPCSQRLGTGLGRVANSLWFSWDFPGFRTERSTSLSPHLPGQTNHRSSSGGMCGRDKVERTGRGGSKLTEEASVAGSRAPGSPRLVITFPSPQPLASAIPFGPHHVWPHKARSKNFPSVHGPQLQITNERILPGAYRPEEKIRRI